MHVIFTRYLGPSNARGSRVKASIPWRKISVTLPFDYGLDLVQMHEKAAAALIAHMGWPEADLALAGDTPDGAGYLFVYDGE
jgi:hypothetical protein